jgi:hypothetical protein
LKNGLRNFSVTVRQDFPMPVMGESRQVSVKLCLESLNPSRRSYCVKGLCLEPVASKHGTGKEVGSLPTA